MVTHTHTQWVACDGTCTPQLVVISIPAVRPNTRRYIQARQHRAVCMCVNQFVQSISLFSLKSLSHEVTLHDQTLRILYLMVYVGLGLVVIDAG